MATLKNTDINDTGYLKLPVGTTAERPVSPQTGYIRYNSTTQIVELYNGTNWVDLTISYLTINGEVYIDNTVLLLQGDNNPTGVTQNNTFIDSSTNNFTITRNGNVTQGTFSPFDKSITNSGGSAYFDGTGDYLTLPDNDAWHFGSGNFTVEAWVYMTSSNVQQTIVGQWDGVGGGTGLSWVIVTSNDANRYLRFLISSNGSTVVFDLVSTSSIPLNQWSHVAIVRNGNVFQLYLNGIAATNGSTTNSASLFNTTNVLTVGSSSTNTQYFFGYISNLRIVKGTAVYTTNFQPSTTPLTAITNTSLLLNFTNAAIFDAVKNNNIETVGNASINTSVFKYGTGSLSFDGTSYLNVGNQSTLDLLSTDFTVEFWLYKNATAAYMTVCGDFLVATTNTWQIMFDVNGTKIAWYNGANNTFTLTSTNTVSNSVWTHIAFVRLGTTLTVYLNGVSNGSTTLSTNYSSTTNLFIGHTPELLAGRYFNGYIDDLRITKGIARYTSSPFTPPSKLSSLIPNYLINRSLRFSSSRSTYLSRTPTVAGNRRTWTWSGWVKRSRLNGYQYLFSGGISAPWDALIFSNNGTNNLIQVTFTAGVSTGTSTIAEYRDPSAWYHIILSVDTTQATASDRFKLYVNGVQITSFVTTNYPAQYTDTKVNSIVRHTIGAQSRDLDTYFDGYMAEVNFIDGQALTPTSFGELSTTTGTWIPKLYTGTYGTNGFRLKFSDLTQLGEDFSGNFNNWTLNNFTTTPGANYDLINDTPINADDTIGNYATLNPLQLNSGTITNGNLSFSVSTEYSYGTGTIAIPSTGKYVFEVTFNSNTTSNNYNSCGLITSTFSKSSPFNSNGGYGINDASSTYGQSFVQNGVRQGLITLPSGTIIQCLINRDANTLTFTKNGVLENGVGSTVTIPSNVDLFPCVGEYSISATINFGQRPFVYTIPTGFKTLNTYNLPTPTIGATTATQANKFMDISLYTGTGTAQSIFNSGAFQPDLVWIKNRTGTASNHALYDSVRGVTKQLSSNTTDAETTETNGLTAFNSNGFTIGSLGQINTSGSTYIAWQWLASASTVTNTNGNISSNVKANLTSGFSVIIFNSGTAGNKTVGHSLGVKPAMFILKNRVSGAAGSNWQLWHQSFSNQAQNYLSLNTTNAVGTDSRFWANAAPTSTVLSFESDYTFLASNNIVGYCWAEIDGFSKFNSYVGNGSTDGTFVYTGFRPKFILIKASSTTGNWVMHNSIVDTSNPVNDELLTNTTANENSIASNDIDFLSNGFKLRSTDSNINTSSATYIYGAFAEFPLKYANASLTERVRETIQVDYLVVAGGGGGGSFIGGGGGAGGYKELLNQTINKNSNYTITIGGGGNGAERVSGSVTQNATSGSSSSAFGTSTTGGGNGGSGSGTQAVSTGGSGGGGAGRGETGANGTTGEGNKGGNGSGSGTDQNTTAGGGGGANGAGGNGVSAGSAGAGGVGKQSTITGVTPTPYYAGGGGGGADSRNGSTSAANGGLGGGGNGGKSSDATNGSVNTGGGGGGGGPLDNETGGNGGSGVVIIKYPNTEPDLTLSVGIQYATSNGTVTTSITSAGQYAPSYTPTGFKVYEFRGTGGVPLNITW